jgi:O-antigen ligase
MNLAIGIGLLIGTMRESSGERTLRQRVRYWAELLLGPKAQLRVCLAIMVVAVVLTRSRMGNTALFVSMLIAGLAALMLFRRSPRPTVVLIASLVAIDILIVGTWFGIEQVQERLTETSLATEQRDDVARDGLRLWRDYPLLGSGAGSFYATFPSRRGPDVSGVNYRAHNDFLQLLIESGAIGFLLLAVPVIVSLTVAVRAQRERGNRLMRGLAFAATMGITAMLLHSTVEFNLQNTANAVLFMVVLALAWHACYLQRRPLLFAPNAD